MGAGVPPGVGVVGVWTGPSTGIVTLISAFSLAAYRSAGAAYYSTAPAAGPSILPRRRHLRTPDMRAIASPTDAPTATFTVTPSSYAPNTSQTVHVTASLGGSGTREAGVTVTAGGQLAA